MSNAPAPQSLDRNGFRPAVPGPAPTRTPSPRPRISLSLRWLHVLQNGRPAESPRPMRVGLLCLLSDPIGGGWSELRIGESILVPFSASVGTTLNGAPLHDSSDGSTPLLSAVEVPGVARIDLLYVVFYQPDLGPIALDPRDRTAVLSLESESAPRLMARGDDHLFLRTHGTLVEEYGRASLLVDPTAYPGRREFVVPVQLLARVDIRGSYLVPGAGGVGEVPRGPVTFVSGGEVVATGEVGLTVAP